MNKIATAATLALALMTAITVAPAADALVIAGTNTTDPCNGIYDDDCICQAGTGGCSAGQYCSQYILSQCIIGL